MVWPAHRTACGRHPLSQQRGARGGYLDSRRGRRAWKAAIPPTTTSQGGHKGAVRDAAPRCLHSGDSTEADCGVNSPPELGEARLPWDLSTRVPARDPESSGNELAGAVIERTASGRRGQAAPARAPGTRKCRVAPSWPRAASVPRTCCTFGPTSQSPTPSLRTLARTRGWSRREGRNP